MLGGIAIMGMVGGVGWGGIAIAIAIAIARAPHQFNKLRFKKYDARNCKIREVRIYNDGRNDYFDIFLYGP